MFRESARRCHVTVHFGSVEDTGVREALRELLYARLNVDLPGHRRILPPGSVRQAFNRARRFFDFVRDELGVVDLHRVDQPLLDRYARHLSADRARRPVIVAQLLEVPADLFFYRDHLPSGGLRFQPWTGRSPARVAGYRQVRENRTPRIPETIISPLLAWSIRYVTKFAADIFAAREELDNLEAHCASLIEQDSVLERKDRRRSSVSGLRTTSVGCAVKVAECRSGALPITVYFSGIPRQESCRHPSTPPASPAHRYRHAGRAEDAHSTHERRSTPDQSCGARARVETGGMNTPVSILPETGKPWRSRFDARTLATEERMLQSAAYILCAYLTGMRDCEVQAMRRGCLSVARSKDGMIMRHCVRSVAYKGKSARGEPAEWVTIEPVARAVEVLERLSFPAASARGLTTLWPVLIARPVCKDHLSAEIVRQLNRFRDHLKRSFRHPGHAGGPEWAW
ncbi:hypothetical protein [Rhizobium sp. 9140]|uniref:hypothetical protein n=1 Tax=Rhizobium sp. 9140 TaxID=1761900 RepID=UPI0032AF4A82